MTVEEKAKAYDDALERAKSISTNTDIDTVLTVGKIFPELTESDDERIRKWIYGIVLNQRKIVNNLVDDKGELHIIDKALAYLEKQKNSQINNK